MKENGDEMLYKEVVQPYLKTDYNSIIILHRFGEYIISKDLHFQIIIMFI